MSEEEKSGAKTVVIDIGKRKRKAVRRLRKGRGKLVDRVQNVIDDLREAGEIGADSDTVVVIVEKKQRRNRGFF